MKKIINLFLCLSLTFVFCLSFSGCKKSNTENTVSWKDVNINNTNFENYFELDGYLGYDFNDGQGNLSSPWADNYYVFGSGITYLEEKNNTIFSIDKSSEIEYNLNNFTSENTTAPQNPLKWRAVIFKAKQDIIIDWIKYKSYFAQEISISPISIQYSIKEYAQNSTENNILLNNVKTYTMPVGQPNQCFKIPVYSIHEDSKYGDVAIFREYYGEEIYEWNERTVLIKQGQLLCVEFVGVEQIKISYDSIINFSDIEQQTNLNFTFENLNFVAKIK